MTKRKSYTLSELVAQCDPDAPVSQDMIDWEYSAAVGLEQPVSKRSYHDVLLSR